MKSLSEDVFPPLSLNLATQIYIHEGLNLLLTGLDGLIYFLSVPLTSLSTRATARVN